MVLRPKIGFVALANPSFQLELAEKTRETATKELRKLDADLITPVKHTVKSVTEAKFVSDKLFEKKVDLVVIMFCSWAYEEVPINLAIDLSNVPILLWSIPEPLELTSICGLLSAAHSFKRLGKQFSYVVGPIADKSVMKKIYDIAKVAMVAKKLRESKVGIAGYAPPGMIDVTADELTIKAIGPDIVHLSLTELLDEYEKISDELVATETEQVIHQFTHIIEPTKKEILDSVRLYLALKEIIKKHNLQAVTVRCWPELRDGKRMTICYAFSRLSDEGIPCACESDVTGAVTQLILYWLSGQPTFNGDLVSVYPNENKVRLWHCGAAPTKLASDPQLIKLRHNTEMCPSGGVQVEFKLKTGKTTLAKLSLSDKSGIMFVASGEAVDTPEERGNLIDIVLDAPVKDFIDGLVRLGLEHHLILAYGDVKEELIELCRMIKVKAIVL